MAPLISVIIPTHNSERTLEKCLESIKNQTFKDIEIIVVDNFSTDGTRAIAKQFTENVLEIGPERTTQKNYGIKNATGKYVCFIDSDMELTDRVLESCIQLFQNKDSIGGICIPEKSIGEGFFVKIRAFERSFYIETPIESARFFLKLDVLAVGGFEEDLIFFEESLLPQKIETKLRKGTHFRINELIYHDEGRISLKKWISKKYYYGKSLGIYTKKVEEIGNIDTGNTQVGIIKRYLLFLSNKRFYKQPILGLGVLFLKTIEFGAGGLGFIMSNFKKYV